MANLQQLGAVLAGGIDRAGAYDEGRFRSARTEEALATAEQRRAQAVAAQQQADLRTQLAVNPGRLANADDEAIGNLILSELGNQYSAAQEGRLRQQEHGNLQTVIDPTSTALERTRALQAAEGKPSPDVVKVGKGYVNLTDDKQQVKFLGDELAGDLSNAGKNYNFEQGLRSKGAPQSEIDNFRGYARADQLANAGGVPYVVNGPGGPHALVDASEVATNAGGIAKAKTEGQGEAKIALDLPGAKARLATFSEKSEKTQQLAESLQANDQLWQAVGLGTPISKVPGTAGNQIRAQLRQLKSRLTLDTLTELRSLSKTGGALGNVSNKDLGVLENYVAALDASQSPEAFRQALQDVIDYSADVRSRLTTAFDEQYPGQRQQAPAAGGNTPSKPGPSAAPAAPVSAAPVQVTSPEQARALPPGTRFITPDGRVKVR